MARPKHNFAGVSGVLQASGIPLGEQNWGVGQGDLSQHPQPKLVNLTNNDVTIFSPDKRLPVHYFRRSNQVVRCDVRDEQIGLVAGIEIVARRFGNIYLADYETGERIGDGLIPELPGTLYIVSLLVLEHLPRRDFIAPDTRIRGAVKDSRGKLLGVTRFIGAE